MLFAQSICLFTDMGFLVTTNRREKRTKKQREASKDSFNVGNNNSCNTMCISFVLLFTNGSWEKQASLVKVPSDQEGKRAVLL